MRKPECANCGDLKERGNDCYCNAYRSAYGKLHYHSNKSIHNPRRAKRKNLKRIELTRNLYMFLLEHPCVVCGEPDPIVLQFDHLENKAYDVSFMVKHGFPWHSISSEIDKCQVLCANCHQRKTAKQFNWLKHQWGVAQE